MLLFCSIQLKGRRWVLKLRYWSNEYKMMVTPYYEKELHKFLKKYYRFIFRNHLPSHERCLCSTIRKSHLKLLDLFISWYNHPTWRYWYFCVTWYPTYLLFSFLFDLERVTYKIKKVSIYSDWLLLVASY